MAELITPQVSDRICKHMNDDHADAVLIYAQIFGNLADSTSARMLAIDTTGMDLEAQVNDQAQQIRVAFDHELTGAEDAHHTLVEMLKQARKLKS